MLGVIFGCLFSFVEVSSANIDSIAPRNILAVDGLNVVQLANVVDERLCIPIGAIWGGLVGLYFSRFACAHRTPISFDA